MLGAAHKGKHSRLRCLYGNVSKTYEEKMCLSSTKSCPSFNLCLLSTDCRTKKKIQADTNTNHLGKTQDVHIHSIAIYTRNTPSYRCIQCKWRKMFAL